MAGSMDVIEFVAREALTNEDKFKRLVAQLGDSSRRNRQNAAGSLAFIAKVSSELLVPYASDLVDALNRPEAQTRWESLDALTALVPVESRCTDKALAGAENALFDEENGFVRLAAMRFFCAYGVNLLLDTLLPADAMVAWGWRIPFICGIFGMMFVAFGCYHLALRTAEQSEELAELKQRWEDLSR